MEEQDFRIEITRNEGRIVMEILPFDFLMIGEILKGFPGNMKITKIHAVMFSGQGGNGDIYINESNYLEKMGEIRTIEDVLVFFKTWEGTYTINKVQFDYDETRVLFDDDALLIISVEDQRNLSNVEICCLLLSAISDTARNNQF